MSKFRYYGDIKAFYVGKMANCHIAEILNKYDPLSSVFLCLEVVDGHIVVSPLGTLPLQKRGYPCVPMTGSCLHHLEYAAHEMELGNTIPRPSPPPRKNPIIYKKKDPKPLTPLEKEVLLLLSQGEKPKVIAGMVGWTINKFYSLKRRVLQMGLYDGESLTPKGFEELGKGEVKLWID